MWLFYFTFLNIFLWSLDFVTVYRLRTFDAGCWLGFLWLIGWFSLVWIDILWAFFLFFDWLSVFGLSFSLVWWFLSLILRFSHKWWFIFYRNGLSWSIIFILNCFLSCLFNTLFNSLFWLINSIRPYDSRWRLVNISALTCFLCGYSIYLWWICNFLSG